MEVFETAESMHEAVTDASCAGHQVGFVPTLGALHDGHLALFERAREENDRLAISRFVNAEQFDTEAAARQYPRDFSRDRELAESAGVDFMFNPPETEMYPEDDSTEVISSSPVTRCYEGTIRPNFFDGVTTIVTKLLNVVPASRVYFGEKDLQQYIAVRRMIEDLRLPHEIVPVPVKRNEAGVAYSSRNRKFDEAGWETAGQVYSLMEEIRGKADSLSRQELFKQYVPKLEETGLEVQYLDVVRFPNYDPAWPADRNGVLILAGYIGEVRLKDNRPMHVESVAELEE